MEQSLPHRTVIADESERALNFGEKLLRLLRETARRWVAVKAQRLGAALAYYTVFSLAPLLIIAILIAGAFFGQTAAQDRVIGQISYLMGPQGASGVAALIAQRPFPGQSGTLATVVSIVTLVLGAIGVFGQLQDAFDTVWDVTPPPTHGLRDLVKRRIMPFGMVLAIGFLLVVATLLNTVLEAISTYLGPSIPFFGLINTGINVVLPLVITSLLFAALFKFVPDVHLAWRDLWFGAILTAILFTLGKVAIGLYLGHSSLANASGAAGSLLVVLVWVYYSAQILLFGAVFTHIYIRYHGQQPVPSGAQPAAARERTTAAQSAPGTVPAAPVWPAPPAPALSTRLEAPPRPGCLGALLGFVAGLGAGVMVALRNHRAGSNPARQSR